MTGLGRDLRRLRSWRTTREGKVFFGVTLGVGFAAINTGNNLLYLVLGLLLSIIILSGVLSDIALYGLEFRRKLPRRAFAGAPMLVEIEVRNNKRWAPSYSIEVEDRIEDRRTDKRCYFLKVSAGACQTAAYRRTPPVRGPERYLALRVATRFPFGLIEKWCEIDLAEEQVVYPSPERAAPPRPAHAAGDMVPREGRGRGDVDGVRELAEGEPVRDIDWKKSAASGRLVARVRRREGAHRVRLELDNRAPAGDAAPEFSRHFEHELKRVAWLALRALHDGTAVELLAHDGGDGAPRLLRAAPSAGAPDRVLSFLARLPPAARPPEAAS
jgi:uncharacterized protein (DUF58 family)